MHSSLTTQKIFIFRVSSTSRNMSRKTWEVSTRAEMWRNLPSHNPMERHNINPLHPTSPKNWTLKPLGNWESHTSWKLGNCKRLQEMDMCKCPKYTNRCCKVKNTVFQDIIKYSRILKNAKKINVFLQFFDVTIFLHMLVHLLVIGVKCLISLRTRVLYKSCV